MASNAKHTKYDSAADELISSVRKSYFGKTADEDFFTKLKSMIEEVHSVKMVASGVIKPVTIPSEESVSNTEFDFSKLPNEILVKIFGYLDILSISCCAQMCKSFNSISKDSLLLKAWGKLSIKEKNVPTEFLGYIFQRGITELNLSLCEILPPKVRLPKSLNLKSEPLNLKTLSLDGTSGDKTLLNEIITSHPMENIDIRRNMNMYLSNNISLFIKCLPKIGSQLKSLNLEYGGLNRYGGATLNTICANSIPLIVDNCLGLEELNISYNILSQESITYLCENLTPNILKLDIRINLIYRYIMNDNHIRALVKRCPKLKVLDIRTTYSKVTYQGLVAISEGLLFLESLGFSKTIEDELGLPNNINLPRMEKLKSMKKLKELLIGFLSNTAEYQSILEREIPNLRENGFSVERKLLTGKLTKRPNQFEVAFTNTKDFRGIEFCPTCHEYEDGYQHKCLVEYVGKPVDEQFLSDLKCSIENKIVAANRAKLS